MPIENIAKINFNTFCTLLQWSKNSFTQNATVTPTNSSNAQPLQNLQNETALGRELKTRERHVFLCL